METTERYGGGYSDGELIEQLLAADNRVEGSITVKDYNNLENTDPESYGPYETNFGSWNAAKEAAGLRLHDFPRDERILSGKDYYTELKRGLECSVCDEDFDGVINLHHPEHVEKEFDISHHGRGARNMKREAEKCIALCANCHLKHHSEKHGLNADSLPTVNAPPILKKEWR